MDEQITLREQLEQNVSEVEKVEEVAEVEQQETAQEREDRLRDEKGRFTKAEETEAVEAPVEAPVEVKKINRPSTWKKDYWEAYDKLAQENPQLAEYINQRESEYAKGVSTYKNEAERAKDIWDALAPFMPELQAHNIKPSHWIQNLGTAHQRLAKGNPQEKLMMFQRLAQDYGVPLQALTGESQQLDPIMQFVNPLYEQVNQLKGQLNSWQTMQQQAEQTRIQQEISSFAKDKEHFEQVRDTMAGLLQSGLAQDLNSAYQAAIRMPQHDDIFQQMQQQQFAEKARQDAEAKQKAVLGAKNKTVSMRSNSPTGKANKSTGSGLREALEEAFESQSSGRV